MKSLKKRTHKTFNSLTDETRWIMYDWANSVFAVSVMSGFFPILFRQYWAKDLASEKVTLYLGLTNSALSLLLFFLLPVMGYLLDFKFKKPQRLLFFTALFGSVFTSLLYFAGLGEFKKSLVFYSIAFVFFALGNTQYDSLLLKILNKKHIRIKDPNKDPNKDQRKDPKRTDKETNKKLNCRAQDKAQKALELDRLSSLGYMFGYIGGGVGLLLQSLVIVFHKEFGFSSPLEPVKFAFFTTGLWWILFSSPLLKIDLEGVVNNKTLKVFTDKPKKFFRESYQFLRSLPKKTLLFLAAFFLYIDVVYTAYKMAADFGLSLGLSQNQMIAALLYVQVVGAPGAYLMLFIAKRFKTSISLYFGLMCYAVVLLLSPFTKGPLMFFTLATFIGLAQGGIQSLSRSYFSSLLPEDKQGLGFGFLNVFGKLSAVLGPLIMGLCSYLLKSPTYSVLSLFPLLFLGAVLLYRSFEEPSV
jgi:UMF1 family MFS transporter